MPTELRRVSEAASRRLTSALIDAVSGCTRALSGSNDTDPAFDAIDGVTLGSLRARGDRAALRRRYHDPGLHIARRPADPGAAAIYDALAVARLDVLGVQWLPGVADNLLAHPGGTDDGVRWLAFEVFSGRDAPPPLHAAAAGVRAALPRADVTRLGMLAAMLRNEREFVAHAAAWSERVARRLQRLVDTSHAAPLPLPRRPTGADIRRGRFAQPGSRRAEDGDTRREDLASSAHVADVSPEPAAGDRGYRAYTTAFDRVVNAAALASRHELAQLRQQLEADMSAARVVVARLAKRLLRVLMARQTREWRFDLEEGLLDSSRLAPFVASGGAARPFKQELDSPFPSTAVTLLIDHSGSMRGRPMQIAAMTVEIFARVLERCGVRCEVLGFTTREWDGGEPARLWAADGYPADPGRLNALEHIVIKAADVPWRRVRVGLGLCLHDDMLKENIDGEALGWAHARLLARPEQRRILVVVSDGTPMDEATFAANGSDYLDRHLVSVVHDIETRSPVQLTAIGIGHDVSRFYRNATRIARIDDLGPALSEKLIALLAR